MEEMAPESTLLTTCPDWDWLSCPQLAFGSPEAGLMLPTSLLTRAGVLPLQGLGLPCSQLRGT